MVIENWLHVLILLARISVSQNRLPYLGITENRRHISTSSARINVSQNRLPYLEIVAEKLAHDMGGIGIGFGTVVRGVGQEPGRVLKLVFHE